MVNNADTIAVAGVGAGAGFSAALWLLPVVGTSKGPIDEPSVGADAVEDTV
ncbi:hypothetical protein OG579_15235 [Williamsia herbipolensis]|uniref:Uncharacterized protein n=1 Tax=Williamsia herbipolensis TaxID=1603258 RepID=A0AAU4JZ49_9NOCA|nr:hypothetical protein [Williamsia herbipolensis]